MTVGLAALFQASIVEPGSKPGRIMCQRNGRSSLSPHPRLCRSRALRVLLKVFEHRHVVDLGEQVFLCLDAVR
jgi:hypothetical protein